MTKQCQSCGMPLHSKKAGDCRGTEADGSKSDTWCSLCYENGAFVGGDCSLEEMINIVDRALAEDGRSKLMRWMARKQIPRLERWSK
jgi:predicted amidophosphoribosyltransferase